MTLPAPLSRRLAMAELAALAIAACGTAPPVGAPADGPSLVAVLVVDQLTPELLERYDPLFMHGLRRLLDDGHRFGNATQDHANTVTAVGHATLATGVYPTRHGIVANTWSERDGGAWRSVYSVQDLERAILGHPDLPGRGPANLERAGLADWILERDGSARVVSVSAKDRSAIGLASRTRGEVYWLEEAAGEFVTSDYYRRGYPAWITRFNREVMPRIYADTVWESLTPPEGLALTRPDESPYETRGVHPVFPHRARDHVDVSDPAALNEWRFRDTPFPDRAVVELAIVALRTLELGRRGSVDFLGVSLSQTDLVGHRWGPGSREQLDNLLRVDRELGRLLQALDAEVGPDRWVLAFSSDHGVLEIPEHLAERGVDARRLDREHRDELLGRLQAASDPEAARRAVLALPFVASAYTFDEIERGVASDSFAVLYARSHSRTRVVGLPPRWDVYVRYLPATLDWSASVTTHGSPHYYDRHVPLVFLGRGVRAGVSARRVETVDVAPTLARLAGIPFPSDLDGEVLEPFLR